MYCVASRSLTRTHSVFLIPGVQVVCVMALLLDGDFTSSRQKPHDIEKSTLVHLCSFFKMKETLAGSTKEPRALLKITLWTTSGLSEVVAVTATNLVAKLHVDI